MFGEVFIFHGLDDCQSRKEALRLKELNNSNQHGLTGPVLASIRNTWFKEQTCQIQLTDKKGEKKSSTLNSSQQFKTPMIIWSKCVTAIAIVTGWVAPLWPPFRSSKLAREPHSLVNSGLPPAQLTFGQPSLKHAALSTSSSPSSHYHHSNKFELGKLEHKMLRMLKKQGDEETCKWRGDKTKSKDKQRQGNWRINWQTNP